MINRSFDFTVSRGFIFEVLLLCFYFARTIGSNRFESVKSTGYDAC